MKDIVENLGVSPAHIEKLRAVFTRPLIYKPSGHSYEEIIRIEAQQEVINYIEQTMMRRL